MEKPCYRRKTPLVVVGTRTQVLADSIAIAASALNHCATYFYMNFIEGVVCSWHKVNARQSALFLYLVIPRTDNSLDELYIPTTPINILNKPINRKAVAYLISLIESWGAKAITLE